LRLGVESLIVYGRKRSRRRAESTFEDADGIGRTR